VLSAKTLQFVAHYSSLVLMRRFATIAFVLSTAWCAARAQQLIGYVSTHDAEVTGASDVVEGHAVLAGQVSVTAKDHTAPITLGRGGVVRVCQTSVVHVTESRAMELAAPLLFSLDRGAIEIQMKATPADAVMTPDLRFAAQSSGPLDLRLRVARNGDTCVENRGVGAPTLAVSDPFGEGAYQLLAGQHVLFEHGSMHEVVDHESSPCGCPDAEGMSVADALLASGALNRGSAAPEAAKAVVEHPFPAAVSEGLAPAPEVPQVAPGAVQPQISDNLAYNAPAIVQPGEPGGVGVGAPATPAAAVPSPAAAAAPLPPVAAVPATPAAAAPAQPAAAPVQAQPTNDVAHIVGRFFRRIFGHR
jgi:hypothetical protein